MQPEIRCSSCGEEVIPEETELGYECPCCGEINTCLTFEMAIDTIIGLRRRGVPILEDIDFDEAFNT